MACAMLATQLDNFLGGEPVQHRQLQGNETCEFMALFPRGVSYKVRPHTHSALCIHVSPTGKVIQVEEKNRMKIWQKFRGCLLQHFSIVGSQLLGQLPFFLRGYF